MSFLFSESVIHDLFLNMALILASVADVGNDKRTRGERAGFAALQRSPSHSCAYVLAEM